MFRKCTAVTAAILSILACAAGSASAGVSPGVQTETEGAQCTANFVFSDGANTYLGQAAHCASTSESTETNGCLAQFHPVGTPVKVQDATTDEFSVTGTLAYSSWSTMRAKGENPDSDTCAYNDLALIKLPAGTVVDPSVPFWGGPTGLATSTSALQDIYTYGNSSLRLGIDQLKPKRGKSLGTNASGWSHTVYTLTPGIPGDSGSGFLDDKGRAFGVLSTVAVAPLPASNGVGDLAKELAYMKANEPAFAGVNLVNGGPFSTARIL
jgi:hypothetical protein